MQMQTNTLSSKVAQPPHFILSTFALHPPILESLVKLNPLSICVITNLTVESSEKAFIPSIHSLTHMYIHSVTAWSISPLEQDYFSLLPKELSVFRFLSSSFFLSFFEHKCCAFTNQPTKCQMNKFSSTLSSIKLSKVDSFSSGSGGGESGGVSRTSRQAGRSQKKRKQWQSWRWRAKRRGRNPTKTASRELTTSVCKF